MINFINIYASVFHMGRYVLANKGMQVEIYIETAAVTQSVIVVCLGLGVRILADTFRKNR